MQNFIINLMVEIQSISKKENSSCEAELSWRDIQGLSWAIEEDNFELNNKLSTYALA